MGRYLTIGITTKLSFEKKKAESFFESVQEAIEYVEDNYAPSDVYDRTENEEYVTFSIKDTILETGLIDFLRDFYSARLAYGKSPQKSDYIIAELKKAKTAEEIMDMAERKCWEYFQEDSYWESICIKHQAWNSLYAYVEGIDLSIDGKILMESYETLFKFLTSIIREKFNKYPISKTLLVTITG